MYSYYKNKYQNKTKNNEELLTILNFNLKFKKKTLDVTDKRL